MGGRWDGRAGRRGRGRRLLAAALVAAAAATTAGSDVGTAAAGATTATDMGTMPSTEGTTTPSGGTSPVADGGGDGDGGALAVWVAGEVVLLVAGAAALRLWTGRRARRARTRPDGRRRPVDACDACTSGVPCPRATTPGGRCDRPTVRIRL